MNDGRFTAPLAVDGNPDTRVSFARDKDEQWMIVDLGDVFDVDHIVIDFFQQVTSYDVFVSVDGKEYTKVYGTTEGVERAENVTDDISLPQAYPARYVKYVQNKRNYYESWNAYYSGGISEFSVYAYDPASYDPLIEQAKAKIDELNGTDEAKRLKSLVSELKRYRNSDFVYKANIERIVSDINALLEDKIPDESEDISETSVEGYGESGLSGGAIAGIIAACAAAAAGIAFAVFAVAKKRKKKDGSAE